MTTKPLGAGWKRVKEFFPSVVAAALMYGAMQQVIGTIKYPITRVAIDAINGLIRKSLPDTMPLRNYGPLPVGFGLKQVAIAVIVFVVGSFIGLWVNLRVERESSK